MKYQNLGKTGLRVSKLCLGMMSYGSREWQPWVLDSQAARRFFQQSLDAGINFFDTADIYSVGQSEEILGQCVAESNRRSDVVLATKGGLPFDKSANGRGCSRKHLTESVNNSLKRLATDYIDLYTLHAYDPWTPLDETVGTLDDLVRAGKILYYGISNFSAAHGEQMARVCESNRRGPIAAAQLQYNLIYRAEEEEMIPVCQQHGIGMTVFSPLARGWLAVDPRTQNSSALSRLDVDAKLKRLYGSASDEVVRSRLWEVAARLGVGANRVALAWLLAKAHIDSVIVGAVEQSHLSDAIAALDIELSSTDVEYLEAAYSPRESVLVPLPAFSA